MGVLGYLLQCNTLLHAKSVSIREKTFFAAKHHFFAKKLGGFGILCTFAAMKQKDYMPDNVFRHEFSADLGRIETPLRVMNMSPQREVVVNAVWDTGASYSSVAPWVIEKLDLPADGTGTSIGVGGPVQGSTSICFAFPGNSRYAALVEASWLPDVKGVPDFIIGLDIILMGEMTLRSHGDKAELTFAFDTSRFIDFEADDPETTMRKMAAFHEQLRRTWARFSGK